MPAETWVPTDWARVDTILDFEIVWLVGSGRLKPMSDPSDPACMVWGYDEPEDLDQRDFGDPVESGGPFVDEVFRAYRNGWITWGPGNTVQITDVGKLFLAEQMLNPPQYR